MHTIIFLLLFFSSLQAQSARSDFSIIIDKPFNDALYSITQNYDRTLSAVGFSKTFDSSKNSQQNSFSNGFDYLESISDHYGAQIHLIRIDEYGDITLSKAQDLTHFNKAVSILKTPSNGYFIGGYTLDGSLLLLKLDSNAQTIFTKTFGTQNSDMMSKLVPLKDGGVLAVASSISTRSQEDNLFETGLGNSDIYLTKFSKDGEEVWSKKYGTIYDDIGIDATEADDASLIIVSKTIHDNNRTISLMRINENGEKIWKKDYYSKRDNAPYKLLYLKDKRFILSLTEHNEMQKEQIRLIKFDLHKNILLDKIVNTSYSSALNDIQEFSDGTLIGVGYIKDAFDTDALVMLLDSDCNMLLQEHYGGKNYDLFTSLKILNDSKVAVAGINTSDDSQESNMWIAKLNRDGSMAKKVDKKLNLNTQLHNLFEEEIKSHKLSLQENLQLEFIDTNLYFEAGKYSLTVEQKKFLDLFLLKLIPFLKENHHNIASLEINGHTSSEWKNSDFEHSYLKNQKLSLNRSFAVLSYIFHKQDKNMQKIVAQLLRGSGMSDAQKKLVDGVEDKRASRRVSFKILLKE